MRLKTDSTDTVNLLKLYLQLYPYNSQRRNSRTEIPSANSAKDSSGRIRNEKRTDECFFFFFQNAEDENNAATENFQRLILLLSSV